MITNGTGTVRYSCWNAAGEKELTTVSGTLTFSGDFIMECTAKLDLTTFLPPEIAVGDTMIGPADFLFAALELLETGADKVTASPREQLGSFKEVSGVLRII